ncbi:MAG: helix-turn-helix transcriptional regulator [Firmicutes bacterium]|nr:helix-turn-helix transcriptional regulator [Bacillota bacterium]
MRIRYLRQINGLTQGDLAKALGISRSTIASWESNRRTPELKAVETIADFFEVSIDFLLGRVNNPNAFRTDEYEENSPDFSQIYYKLPEKAQESIREFIEFVKHKYNVEEKDK